jgi:hypothetical protein
MKLALALTATALLALSSPVFAQGASSESPGHQMQEKGSVKGSPGASGYAPGHEMKNKSGLSEGRSSATTRDSDDTMTKAK